MDQNITIIGFKLSDYWSKLFRALDLNFLELWIQTFSQWIQNFPIMNQNFQIIGFKLSDYWIKIFQIIGSNPDLTDRQCYVLQTERSPPVMSCLLPPPLATSSLLSQARISLIFFQRCGSGSAFILVGWIRIRIHKGKMTHKNRS